MNKESTQKHLEIKDAVIKPGEFSDMETVESISLPNATRIEAGAFKDCRCLKSMFFGFDVDHFAIEEGAFEGCLNLTDIHFMVKPDASFDIADGAFKNANPDICFHVPLFGFDYLSRYARKHHFKIQKHI